MEKLKIVTFNLRCVYDHPRDGINSFVHRAGLIIDKIRKEKPHIICFQEVSNDIRSFLTSALSGYGIVGHGRLKDYNGEGLSIAYRADCMELFALEQFWLSPTPYVPASRYEIQSEYPRICPCAVLKHRNMQRPVRVYNVHLDHIGDAARILGMQQILEKVTQDNERISYPSLILGDFNCQPNSETVAYCNSCKTYPLVDLTAGIGETFHNFGGAGASVAVQGQQIDYIFADPETAKRAVSVTKWTDSTNGIYLSDHYPVCCELDFTDEIDPG